MGMGHLVLGDLGFPIWLRIDHWINFIFMGLLIRSGIQILGSYPRLYWNEHSQPGTEWAKFTKKKIPNDKLWITLDQEVHVPMWLGQPGEKHLGLGRHWHFFSILFWMLNGVVYVVLLFATGEWTRLIPTSWSIFPDAWHTFVTYITFHLPPASAFHPYDPLQQLAYAGVVFLLGPFLIVTGAAQSPAIAARAPWFVNLFGGKQRARSLHFLGLLAFVAFIIVHVALVIITGFGPNMDKIVLGQDHGNEGLAVGIGLGIIAATFIGYWLTSYLSLKHPRGAQRALGAVIHPVLNPLAVKTKARPQSPPFKHLSPQFLVNGMPPQNEEYTQLEANDFHDYRLTISGLVQHPLSLSLTELRAMRPVNYTTRHECIQGWTSIGAWRGVPLNYILLRCEPTPEARYAVFWSYSEDTDGKPFYETLDLTVLKQPETYLAYEMNAAPVPYAHGAPLRLRAETQLGFKMVKWLREIEFVADYSHIRDGQGGSREDEKYYDQAAGI
jgi:sulfoxide reductase catalytic subunit YedY